MIRVYLDSLGCSKNQIDAERMLFNLKENGLSVVFDDLEADVVIINTCAFIQSAKEEAIEEILKYAELKNEGKIKGLIITGCLSERYRDEVVKEFPEADAVLGIGSNEEIVKAVKKAYGNEHYVSFGNKENLKLNGGRIRLDLPHIGYLKIADGCSNNCAYCAIPKIRGKLRSVPINEVLQEAKKLISENVKELILIAQDSTVYGLDLPEKSSLKILLKKLCELDGDFKIRLLYCYPERIDDELIDIIKNEDKILNYLDIPIQHSSNKILKSMNRHITKEQIQNLIDKLRKQIPDIAIRTTVMVGFPGETKEDFEDLYNFIDKNKFERLGCFAYSREENTEACYMENQIPEDIKDERRQLIETLQYDILIKQNRNEIGKVYRAVVDGKDEALSEYIARSYKDAPEVDTFIIFNSNRELNCGDFVTLKITDCNEYDLVGELLEEK